MFFLSVGGIFVGVIFYVVVDGVVFGLVVLMFWDVFECLVECVESVVVVCLVFVECIVFCFVVVVDFFDGFDFDVFVIVVGDVCVGFLVVVYVVVGDEVFVVCVVLFGVDDYLVCDEIDDFYVVFVELVWGVLDWDVDDCFVEMWSYCVIVEVMEDGVFVFDEDCCVEYVNF